jgi:hypothetical protein
VLNHSFSGFAERGAQPQVEVGHAICMGETVGVTYLYVNHDKQQFFTCGLFGCAGFRSIGIGHSARAAAILLSDNSTWKENRISVMRDTSEDFSNLQWSGLDIEVEVVLTLIEVDGLEWIEAELDGNIEVFTCMCDFAFHQRDRDVIKLLDHKFGAGKWQRKYENYAKGNTDFWAQKVIQARDRALRLLVLDSPG